MKRFIVFCALIVSIFMIPIPVQADPMYIDLISASCSTSGVGYDYPVPVPPYHIMFSWNESGTTSAIGMNERHVFGSAIADVGKSTASLDAWIPWFIREGEAYAAITFRPIGASYVDISGSTVKTGVDNMEVKLIDQTTSKTLLYFNLFQLFINGQDVSEQWLRSPYFWSVNFQDAFLPVDPSHTYLLSTLASVRGDEAGTRASASMSLGVPEPSSMLLLGLGMMGLAAVRRKFKN